MSELLAKTAARYVKPTYTEVAVGDTVRVYTLIKEGEKERTQFFEGLVIRRRGGIGPNATFTVRKLSGGVGVERNFALHSPTITKIEVKRGARLRRATLYTIRGLTGKAARLTEQPVKQADRERTHPWLDKFGLKASDSEQPDEAVAPEEAVAEAPKEADEGADEAAKAEAQPKTPIEKAQAETEDAKKDTANEKTDKSKKPEAKADPSDAKAGDQTKKK